MTCRITQLGPLDTERAIATIRALFPHAEFSARLGREQGRQSVARLRQSGHPFVDQFEAVVEGVVLGINSFDQWGVELGKELALALQPVLEGKAGTEGKDGSTAALVRFLRG